jgi:hypothetical protein
MTAPLTIGRLHSRFKSSEALDDHTIAQWHDTLRQAEPSALVDQLIGPEEWLLIRQLDLSLKWQLDSAPLDVGQRWSRALEQAVAQAANTPNHPDVVRYASRRHGLADLLYRSALGETQRQWAWQRMGWIESHSAHPDQVLHQGLSQLLAQPDWIWPMLNQWLSAEASTGALSALLRAVPGSWWSLLLMRADATAPYAAVAADQASLTPSASVSSASNKPTAALLQSPAERAAMAARHAEWAPLIDVDPAALQGPALMLWQWLRSRPHLAERHAPALSILLAALAWPGRGVASALARQRVRWAREVVAQAARPHQPLRREQVSATTASLAAQGQHTSTDHLTELTRADPHDISAAEEINESTSNTESTPDDDLPLAPELPNTESWESTDWAGALFWLRLAGQAGVLDQAPGMANTGTQAAAATDTHQHAADTTPSSSTDALGHALLALARALGVPDGDATQRAFVGGTLPEGPSHPALPEGPSHPALPAWATQQVAQWSDWLAQHAPDLPTPRVTTVCQRPGRLRFEPGWIELHLSIDHVDTRIRRLGLDVDPGYLPWLGCVVRICYD